MTLKMNDIVRRHVRSRPFNVIVIFFMTVLLVCYGKALTAFAMDIEARQWEHIPIDINILGAAYAYTSADIYVDPVLNMDDVEMSMNTTMLKYVRSFGLLGKSARVDITQGYMDGKWTGLLNGSPASASRSGFSDTFVRFAANIYGAPPLRSKEYAEYRAKNDTETIIGIGLAVRLPTGEYMSDRLVNLGQNQYVLRPQLGMSYRHKKWAAELTEEVAISSINDDFYNGRKLKQGPVGIIHTNLVYRFRPGLWVGGNLAYDYGGRVTVNGVKTLDHAQNIGWALNFAIPLSRQAGIKLSYIGTHTLEATGMDSSTFSAGVVMAW
jgi:hypothetical protein